MSFFSDTATTEIYTLSLHDALPIFERAGLVADAARSGGHAVRVGHIEAHEPDVARRCELLRGRRPAPLVAGPQPQDRKSTRLNSSHGYISYAVFCLKKKNTHTPIRN